MSTSITDTWQSGLLQYQYRQGLLQYQYRHRQGDKLTLIRNQSQCHCQLQFVSLPVSVLIGLCVYVCVCVCARARVCVCVCVCVPTSTAGYVPLHARNQPNNDQNTTLKTVKHTWFPLDTEVGQLQWKKHSAMNSDTHCAQNQLYVL